MAKYINGHDCKNWLSCNLRCKECNYYKKKKPENNYGRCQNQESVNYKDEVYDTSCCFYICQKLYNL
jgi:hypothetical protein